LTSPRRAEIARPGRTWLRFGTALGRPGWHGRSLAQLDRHPFDRLFGPGVVAAGTLVLATEGFLEVRNHRSFEPSLGNG
jgi:hypothetical protein